MIQNSDHKFAKVERVVPNALLKVYARLRATCSTSSWDKPIHLELSILIALTFLVSCETANYAPIVNNNMVAVSHRRDVDPSTSLRTSLAKLERGRTLFVHRCIECHTLPVLWHYTPKDWTEIVNSMSHRASLKPAERDAIIAYILAVRATER